MKKYWLLQGILTGGEGSVLLTSSLGQFFVKKVNTIFNTKGADLN